MQSSSALIIDRCHGWPAGRKLARAPLVTGNARHDIWTGGETATVAYADQLVADLNILRSGLVFSFPDRSSCLLVVPRGGASVVRWICSSMLCGSNVFWLIVAVITVHTNLVSGTQCYCIFIIYYYVKG